MFHSILRARAHRPRQRVAAIATVVALVGVAACGSDGATTQQTPATDRATDAPAGDPATDAPATDPATDPATAGAGDGAGKSDDDVIAAFLAAIQAGDRDAAGALAPPDALIPFEPWEPLPGIVVNFRDGALFQIQPGAGWIVDCTVGGGRIVECVELFDGEEGDGEEGDGEEGDGEEAGGEEAGGDGEIAPGFEEIEFFPGDPFAIADGELPAGGVLTYLLSANAGQALLADLSVDAGSATFDVVSPSGVLVTNDATSTSALLDETGFYGIPVSAGPDGARYSLFIGLYAAEVVRFDPGTSGTTLSDSVIRGDRSVYVLGAQGGQTMSLSISSVEDNAVFDLYAPGGARLLSESTSTSLDLPADGNYLVVVGGTRGNASFDLDVSII